MMSNDSGDHDTHEDGFSPLLLDILRWTPVLPAFFSIVGSLLITQRIARSRKLRSMTYERLVVGLSLVDTLNSFRLLIFTFAYRPYIEPSTACTVDGFLVTLCFAGPMYNAALALYYVLVILHNVPDQRISSYYEPWLHATAIMYGVVGAFLGLLFQVYNPSGRFSCWASEWPPGCGNDDSNLSDAVCERGAQASNFAYGVGILPLLGVFVLLIGTNTAIFCYVRDVLAKTERYTNPTQGFANSAPDLAVSASIGENQQQTDEDPTAMMVTDNNNQTSSVAAPKVAAVAVQSISYVLAYLLCFIWSLLLVIVEAIDPTGTHFALHLLQMIFFPSQGIFNVFVYARPTVLRMRRQYPCRSMAQCVWAVLFN